MILSSVTLQKFYKVGFMLLLFIFLLQYFYTFSMKDLTKMNNPTNSLFYIELGTAAMKASSNLTNISLQELDSDAYETVVEEDNSSRDALDSSVVNNQEWGGHANNSCVSKRKLRGYLKVNLSAPPFFKISQELKDLQMGGHFVPNCSHTQKVALIVPFRDRKEHLGIFLYNIHPMLQRQEIEYKIFVIEQDGTDPFNRAMLFNVGFKEALKNGNFSCFIFHDVDLIPENDHNLYDCPSPTSPRHMSVAVDTLRYRLPYKAIFGGISALTREQFRLVNGFSNRYWGWGAEDDDMANRIAFHGLYISRYSPIVARYKMLKHKHQKPNTNRYKILHKGKQHFGTDGLSNLNYTVEEVAVNRLYTLVKVRLEKL